MTSRTQFGDALGDVPRFVLTAVEFEHFDPAARLPLGPQVLVLAPAIVLNQR